MTAEKATMSLQCQQDTPPRDKIRRIMRAQEGSMCLVSLIAIELKGLAAPGEALKFSNIIITPTPDMVNGL